MGLACIACQSRARADQSVLVDEQVTFTIPSCSNIVADRRQKTATGWRTSSSTIVLEESLHPLLQRWKYMEDSVEGKECNIYVVAFADDLCIVTRAKEDASKVVAEFKEAPSKFDGASCSRGVPWADGA